MHPDGTAKHGRTTVNSHAEPLANRPQRKTQENALQNFDYLYRKLIRLYAMGSTGSISKLEAAQIAESLSFVLGIHSDSDPNALKELAEQDPDVLFQRKQAELSTRVDRALETWRAICVTMPSINNVALRDSLANIGNLKALYDTYFAAHEVPLGNLQYQLSSPVSESLLGIEYVQAWLDQLLAETRYISQFTTKSCIAVLERACPDYKGLHVNLYDLLAPYENQLERKATPL